MSPPGPQSVPRCLTCDHLLASLPDPRCPECGRPFDPADPSTVNLTGRPYPVLARLFARPIGLPLLGLAFTAFAWPLWEHRTPYNVLGAPVLGYFLWALVLVLLAGRLLIRFAVLQAYHRPESERRIGRHRKWLIATLLLVYVVIPTDPIMRTAFRLSRPALDRFAQAALANPGAYPGTHRVGLFWVQQDGTPAPGALRLWAGQSYESHAGFAYCPNGPPANPDSGNHTPLDGPWFAYTWDDRTARLSPPPTSVPCPIPSPATQP